MQLTDKQIKNLQQLSSFLTSFLNDETIYHYDLHIAESLLTMMQKVVESKQNEQQTKESVDFCNIESKILELLKTGKYLKTEISKTLSLSFPAVCSCVDKLYIDGKLDREKSNYTYYYFSRDSCFSTVTTTIHFEDILLEQFRAKIVGLTSTNTLSASAIAKSTNVHFMYASVILDKLVEDGTLVEIQCIDNTKYRSSKHDYYFRDVLKDNINEHLFQKPKSTLKQIYSGLGYVHSKEEIEAMLTDLVHYGKVSRLNGTATFEEVYELQLDKTKKEIIEHLRTYPKSTFNNIFYNVCEFQKK